MVHVAPSGDLGVAFAAAHALVDLGVGDAARGEGVAGVGVVGLLVGQGARVVDGVGEVLGLIQVFLLTEMCLRLVIVQTLIRAGCLERITQRLRQLAVRLGAGESLGVLLDGRPPAVQHVADIHHG